MEQSGVTLDRLHEPRGASIGGRFAQTRRGGPGLARRSAFLIGTALLTSVIIPHAASAGDADAGRRKAETCAACHGPEGNPTIPTVPAIAGQPEVYLHWQLMLFRDNRRRDPQMTPLTAKLSDEDAGDLAAYYASQKPAAKPAARGDGDTMTNGRRVSQAYHCWSCHAPDQAGQRYAPNITGQSYEYVLKQLRGFKSQTRGDLDGTMTSAAQPLTDADIEVLARYLAALPPATRP